MFYVFLTNTYTEDKNHDDDDGARNPIALIEQQHNSELAFHLIASIHLYYIKCPNHNTVLEISSISSTG